MSSKCPMKNCVECFADRKKLKEHLLYYHNYFEAIHICQYPKCNLKFETIKDLNAHEKTHREVCCPICNGSFSNKKYLKQHMETHSNTRDSVQCGFCDKKFLYKSSLNVHIKVKHNNQRFDCIYCAKSLCSKQKLSQHVTLFHSNEEVCVNTVDMVDEPCTNQMSLIDDSNPPSVQSSTTVSDSGYSGTCSTSADDYDILQACFDDDFFNPDFLCDPTSNL